MEDHTSFASTLTHDNEQPSSSPDYPVMNTDDEEPSSPAAFTDTEAEPEHAHVPEPEQMKVDQALEPEPDSEPNQTSVDPMETADTEEGITGVVEVKFDANCVREPQNEVRGTAREALSPYNNDPRVKALLDAKRGIPEHRMVQLIGAVMGVHSVMASGIASRYIEHLFMNVSLRLHRTAAHLKKQAASLASKRASRTRSLATVSRLEQVGVRTKKQQDMLESARNKAVGLWTEVSDHQAEMNRRIAMAGFTEAPGLASGPAQ